MEIDREGRFELEHLMYMLRVAMAEKQSEPGELSHDFFLRDDFVGPVFYESTLSLFTEFQKLNFL